MVRHKLLLTVLALSVILPAAAQNGTFGYLDFNGTMKITLHEIKQEKKILILNAIGHAKSTSPYPLWAFPTPK